MALVRNLQDVLIDGNCAIHAAPPETNPCGVVSFCMDAWECEDVGYILNHAYDIRLRTGLHCAPRVHHYTGTYPDGIIRVSFSVFNTADEVQYLAGTLDEIRGSA
jgi:selenocysteine lyase/cysteine desulfurase